MIFGNSLYKLQENVYEFLRGIPSSLLDILGFGPNATSDEYKEYIQRAIKITQENYQRHEKMRLQKKYGLPLRPNQGMRELRIVIKIIELKKRKEDKNKQGEDDSNDGFLI